MNWRERLLLGRTRLVTASVISAFWIGLSAVRGQLEVLDFVAVLVVFALVVLPARRSKRPAAKGSSLYGPPE